MKSKNKTLIRIVLAIVLIVVVSYTFLYPEMTASDNVGVIPSDGFTTFAILVSIAYEMIPSVAKQFFSVGAIGIKLLMQGFSPILFGILLALGQLAGQMILYGVGIFARHVHKGSIGDLASKNHFLHQHHFLVYLIVPFASVLGDAVMIYSGHQRINPLKIVPFLFISNLADNYKWIYMSLGQLEISEVFS